MATKTVETSKVMVRMGDLASEPKRMLPPIKGYEKGQLVSLEQAVIPIISFVPDVGEMVWTVQQNCQHPKDQLSSDESASIMLYTLERMPRESSFYFILNQALRSQNRQELLPWFSYLRLFIFALSKLPPIKHRIIYRGIKMDLSEQFPKDETFLWWAFSSCTSSIKVLENFLGQNGQRTIFNIECDSAKDISQHSFYQTENEILIYPARQFQVTSSFDAGNQLKIIQTKEIQPPFPLIHIPPSPNADQTKEIQLPFPLIHIPPSLNADQTKEIHPPFPLIHLPPSLNADQTKEIHPPFPLIHLPPSLNADQTKEIEPYFSYMQISRTPSSNKYQNKQLQHLIEHCEPQSRVNLKQEKLNDKDMEIVVKEAIINKQCKTLELSQNKITAIGISIIAEALNNNTTLQNLYLTDIRLRDIGVQSLTKTLSLNNSRLLFLDLQDTGITDEGAEYIALMLKTNTTLRIMLLSNNLISDRGVDHLANVLTYHNKTLTSLYLNSNELIRDLSIDTLVQVLTQNQTLTRLVIRDCNLSENGKDKLHQITKLKKGFNLSV